MRRIRSLLSALVLANLALGPQALAQIPHDSQSDAIGEQIADWQQELGEDFRVAMETVTDTSVLETAARQMAKEQAQALAKALRNKHVYYAGTFSQTGTVTATGTGTVTVTAMAPPTIDVDVPAVAMQLTGVGGVYSALWWKTGTAATAWVPLGAGATPAIPTNVVTSTDTSTFTGDVRPGADIEIRAATSTATSTSVVVSQSPTISVGTGIVRTTDTRLTVGSATLKAGPGIVLKGTSTATATEVPLRDSPTVQLDTSIATGTDILRGGGTANYGAKYASPYALTPSLYYDDGVSAGIGVGTSVSATYRLTVGGSGWFTGDLNISGGLSGGGIAVTCSAGSIPRANVGGKLDASCLPASIVAGTFTSGYILRASGAHSAEISQLYDDSAHNGIGFGITSVDNAEGWQKAFEIHGTDNAKFQLTTASGSILGGSWVASLPWISGAGQYFGTRSNHPLYLITNGALRLTLSAAGNATFTGNIGAANITGTPTPYAIPTASATGDLNAWVPEMVSSVGGLTVGYLPIASGTRTIGNSYLYQSGNTLYTTSAGLTLGGPFSASNVALNGANNILKLGTDGFVNGAAIPRTTAMPKGTWPASNPGNGSSVYVPREDHVHPRNVQVSWAGNAPGGTYWWYTVPSGTGGFPAPLIDWPVSLSGINPGAGSVDGAFEFYCSGETACTVNYVILTGGQPNACDGTTLYTSVTNTVYAGYYSWWSNSGSSFNISGSGSDYFGIKVCAYSNVSTMYLKAVHITITSN